MAVKAGRTAIPWQAQTIFDQLGGTGITGALAYTGAHQTGYKVEQHRAMFKTWVDDHGCVYYEVGVQWTVNLGPGIWKAIVALEPNDTYTVRLWWANSAEVFARTGITGRVVKEERDVYCDNLQQVVEHQYDQALEAAKHGFAMM